jgi:SAM-dependent methyltransferase
LVYSFELIKHANIRYRDSLIILSRCELFAMLFALGVTSEIRVESLGGSRFLTVECRDLNESEIAFLSGHSSFSFMAENRNGLLHPLPVSFTGYLPEDLPEVLKYKGKTSAPFMRMMINTAVSLSAFRHSDTPLTFFDPVCGKGTGCFCAVTAGMNAVGLDLDRKDIREASDYFSRYLKLHKLKHEVRNRSETASGHALPVTEYIFSDTKDHFRSGDCRTLSFTCGDTLDSPALFRRQKPHIMAADLPYGIQHAPQAGSRPDSLQRFLGRVLPVWKKVLAPGGVLALSFNTLTLPSADVREALTRAGFRLPVNDIFQGLKHEVEQAVVRDLVFAFNSEEESVI